MGSVRWAECHVAWQLVGTCHVTRQPAPQAQQSAPRASGYFSRPASATSGSGAAACCHKVLRKQGILARHCIAPSHYQAGRSVLAWSVASPLSPLL